MKKQIGTGFVKPGLRHKKTVPQHTKDASPVFWQSCTDLPAERRRQRLTPEAAPNPLDRPPRCPNPRVVSLVLLNRPAFIPLNGGCLGSRHFHFGGTQHSESLRCQRGVRRPILYEHIRCEDHTQQTGGRLFPAFNLTGCGPGD